MLTLQVKEQIIENLTPDEKFIRGTVGAKCQIKFDEFWSKYEKTVVFQRKCQKPINIIVNYLDNEIEIPYEILQKHGKFKIGVFGITENEVLPTLWSKDIEILCGTDTHGTNPQTYTPSEIDQLRLSKQDKLIAGQGIKIENDVIFIDGEIGVQPDLNQNDPAAPDYVKNRTHYSYKQFEDIIWNGDETGHEVVTPWDEDERFIKMSDTVFGVENIIGGKLFLNDDTDFEITLDNIDDSFSGGFFVDYSILIVVSSEELNAIFDLPTGTFSNGVYFIKYTGESFVTKLAFPETIKKLDEKYLPEFAPVAKTGMYKDLLNTPTVDQNYRSTSENAQSGKAVARAVSGFIPKKPLDNPSAPFDSVVAVYNGFFDDEGKPTQYIYINVEDEGVGLQAGWIVRRKSNSTIATEIPVDDMDCANKKYVDDAIANMDISGGNYVPTVESNGHTDLAYVMDSFGQNSTVEIEDTAMYEFGLSHFTSCIPRRTSEGSLLTITPTKDLECANKKYVDDLVGDIETLLGGI